MIKYFTVKEKLMSLFSEEAAVSRALERIKDEFKAIDPTFYEYIKYQYDIKFVADPVCYKRIGFRVEIKYNKDYFKYRKYLEEYQIQRFETFCDLNDYYFESRYQSDCYNSIAELFNAVQADVRKFDGAISEFESNVQKYEKYLDAGFIFSDILSARDYEPTVFLSIETFDKYFDMLPPDADKENYRKYIIKEFKERQEDPGMPITHDSNAWVTTYEYWAENHVEFEKEEADEAAKNEKYKALIDEINK